MTTPRIRRFRAAQAALALAAGLAIAGSAHAVKPSMANKWTETLVETSGLLKEQEYDSARRKLKGLTDEMVETLGPGEAAAQALAIVVVQRAIADAGRGDRDDALWYWHVALALDPRVAASDLSSFGEVTKLFSEPVPALELPVLGGPLESVEKPRTRKRERPHFPRAAFAFGTEGALIVRTIIGLDGKPRFPSVKQSLPTAALTFVALDAVKDWRFEPARINGKPAEMVFELTVNWGIEK